MIHTQNLFYFLCFVHSINSFSLSFEKSVHIFSFGWHWFLVFLVNFIQMAKNHNNHEYRTKNTEKSKCELTFNRNPSPKMRFSAGHNLVCVAYVTFAHICFTNTQSIFFLPNSVKSYFVSIPQHKFIETSVERFKQLFYYYAGYSQNTQIFHTQCIRFDQFSNETVLVHTESNAQQWIQKERITEISDKWHSTHATCLCISNVKSLNRPHIVPSWIARTSHWFTRWFVFMFLCFDTQQLFIYKNILLLFVCIK